MHDKNSTIKFCRSLATGSTRVFYIESRQIFLWSLSYQWLLCIVFLSIAWPSPKLVNEETQDVTRTLTCILSPKLVNQEEEFLGV